MEDAMNLLNSYAELLGASGIVSDDRVTKVSIVGAGMESHPGVAAEMFEALFTRNVNIQMISTSEIKISVSVSYTHLDVYKRQAWRLWRWAAFPRAPRCGR